ncbi:MAG: hypothetical protein IT440_03145 [Phycisphaeraceae bacterium]|nr:hypothetical protein [Phycisphaeraceae bacterium]
MRTSPHFVGPIATGIPAAEMALSNLAIEDGLYDYEGNWFFCALDGPRTPVMRIGFGRGRFAGTDYTAQTDGPLAEMPAGFLAVHVEVVTDEGAVCYVPAGAFDPNGVKMAKGRHEVEYLHEGKRIFRLAGWPRIDCDFRSADGELTVTAQVDVETVVIFPDTLLPNNRFAMWGSVGKLNGECVYRGERMALKGSAFFDHPRIRIERTGAAKFGFYLYQPIRLSDGSHIISYVTEDFAGNRVADGVFVMWISPEGKVRTLWNLEAFEMKLDGDRHLETWRTVWDEAGVRMEIRAKARPLPLLRAWGSPMTVRTRAEYRVFPLPFDVEVKVSEGGKERRLSGHGLSEMIPHPGLVKRMA